MATISENLKTIKDSTAAIKQAILDKGGEVGDLTTYAEAITNLPSGGGNTNPTAEKNDVTFYDYDGAIRYSYTADEFLVLSEMPPLPRHQGLICQEWNWLFEDAREYVSKYGILDVGATYVTDDGKTRLYIRIAAEGRMDVPLYFSQTASNGVTIDWGDGSATETLSGTGNVNKTHRYASIGDYCISLGVADGCTLGLGHNSSSYCVMGSADNNGRVYCNMLQKVEIGTGVTTITGYAFYYCTSLTSVALPQEVTSIASYAFDHCYGITSVTFPKRVVSILNHVFNFCNSLVSVVLPKGVTSIGNYAFNSCNSLASMTLPKGMTSIGIYVFNSCNSLASMTLPKGMTSIGIYVFGNCYGMTYYDFSSHTEVPTLANTNAFTSIPADCKIIVPDNLYDTWIAATNWSTYASYIIKKTDWDNLQ